MNNKEKIKELEIQRTKELNSILLKYAELIKPLYHQFTKTELELLGWERIGSYGACNELMYEKNERQLRVGPLVKDKYYLEENIYLMTYSGSPNRTIVDVDDLNEYEKTGE